MYETARILTTIKQNKIITGLLLFALLIPITAAIQDSPSLSSNVVIHGVKYIDPEGSNSITFYDDGTFFIDQKTELTGTYIENDQAYGITYSESGYGKTIKKVQAGIKVPDGRGGSEIWIRV